MTRSCAGGRRAPSPRRRRRGRPARRPAAAAPCGRARRGPPPRPARGPPARGCAVRRHGHGTSRDAEAVIVAPRRVARRAQAVPKLSPVTPRDELRRRGSGSVVADDHPFFRDGVSRGLTMSGRVEVVGEADDGRPALEPIRRERPDVALVDHQMPDVDGLGVVRAMVRDGLPTRVLLLSAHTDSGIVFQAIEAGAAGYLSKDARRPEIVEAVQEVARGRTVVPPESPLVWRRRSGCARSRPGPRSASGSGRCCGRSPEGSRCPGGRRAVPGREHGQDPHPAALREARGVRPGGGGGRGDAARPGGMSRKTRGAPAGGAGVAGCGAAVTGSRAAARRPWRRPPGCRSPCR